MRAGAGYSIKEAAVLAGLSERAIRNEIDRGVARVARKARGRRRAVALPKGAVLYFRLLREMPVPLPRRDRTELFRLLSTDSRTSGEWERIDNTFRRGMVRVDTAALRKDLDNTLGVYDSGRERAVSDPDILGGEPVFAGTRISIRHIGRLALRGIPVERIRGDYPSLADGDVRFAKLFAAMKPPPGRPRKLRFRREAA